MDRFLEEIVKKNRRGVDEVLYYASWVLMIGSALLGFMSLQMMMYSFGLYPANVYTSYFIRDKHILQ